MTNRPHTLDLTGGVFGRWTVLSRSHANVRGEVLWACRCECGVERSVKAGSLRSGRSTSCGCRRKDSTSTHGMTKTPTWKSWNSMKQRCMNPNAPDYRSYGGRGVTLCPEWASSFEAFLRDMGERPKGHSIDRIDVNGGYSPENCRWATASQQQRNKTGTTVVELNGQNKPIAEWAEALGVRASVIQWRLDNGWSAEQAVTTPKRPRKRHHSNQAVAA